MKERIRSLSYASLARSLENKNMARARVEPLGREALRTSNGRTDATATALPAKRRRGMTRVGAGNFESIQWKILGVCKELGHGH